MTQEEIAQASQSSSSADDHSANSVPRAELEKKESNNSIPEVREMRRELRAMRAEFFSGPIPPPDILAKYDDIIPNGAERILAMAEHQEIHRHEMEKAIVMADIQQSRLGLVLGFVVVMTMGIGGMILIWHGNDINGLAIVLSALAGLMGSFLYSVKKKGQRATSQEIANSSDKDGSG